MKYGLILGLVTKCSTLSGDARTRLGKSAMRLAGPAVAGELHFVVDSFDPEKNQRFSRNLPTRGKIHV